MNIFYLDNDPMVCAQMHNDKHCVKMILETAQLLSSSHHLLNDTPPEGIYKMTHKNHPSAIWARHNRSNYMWLYLLFVELCAEYTFRYGKTHKTEAMKHILCQAPQNIPEGEFTEPTPAMPDECKVPGNSLASYRSYYIMNKGHLATWKKRNKPEWYNA
jgi:hypothetical protein